MSFSSTFWVRKQNSLKTDLKHLPNCHITTALDYHTRLLFARYFEIGRLCAGGRIRRLAVDFNLLFRQPFSPLALPIWFFLHFCRHSVVRAPFTSLLSFLSGMWFIFVFLAGALALCPVKDFRVKDLSSKGVNVKQIAQDRVDDALLATTATSVSSSSTSYSNSIPTIGLDASVQALWTDSSNSIYYINSTIDDHKTGFRQIFPLLLDTGSEISWIYNVSCTSSACLNAPKFNDSGLYTTSAFQLSYSGLVISGSMVDTLHNNMTFSYPNGLALSNYSFGLADSAPLFFNDYNVSGIIGIPSVYNETSQTNFIAQLDASGAISSRKFGIILGGSANSNSSFGGLLLLGDSASENADKLATSDVDYCSLDENTNGYWLVTVTMVAVLDSDEENKSLSTFNSSRQAIIDTGTTGLSIPLDDANALHEALFGSLYVTDGEGNYAFLCNATGEIDFTISGKNFTIPVENIRGNEYTNKVLEGYCASKAQGSLSTSYWILGGSFLKSFYTIFDLDNFKIGFAPSVDGFATSVASKSQTATSSMSGSFSTIATSTIASSLASNLTTSSSNNAYQNSGAGVGSVALALICMLY